MPPREFLFRLQDIANAISDIEKFSSSIFSKEELVYNKMAFYAILKALEIIGEAAHHIPEDVKSNHRDVPWIELKDFRNKLSHEYFGVDVSIIFAAIKIELPILKKQIEKIIQKN